MLFKFINPSVTIDILSFRKEDLDLYPIDFTKKFIPNWFKEAPSNVSDNPVPMSSLKKCVGIQDLFGSGITIPNWSDAVVYKKLDKNEINISFADGKTLVDFHPSKQWKYYLDEDNHFHFKIVPPWQIRSSKNIKFLFTGFHWGLNPFLLHIPTAIVRFKYQNSCNINGFIKPNSFEKIILNAGKPLVQLIPLTEKKIKINYNLVSVEEFNRNTEKLSLYFHNRYKRLEKKLRRIND